MDVLHIDDTANVAQLEEGLIQTEPENSVSIAQLLHARYPRLWWILRVFFYLNCALSCNRRPDSTQISIRMRRIGLFVSIVSLLFSTVFFVYVLVKATMAGVVLNELPAIFPVSKRSIDSFTCSRVSQWLGILTGVLACFAAPSVYRIRLPRATDGDIVISERHGQRALRIVNAGCAAVMVLFFLGMSLAEIGQTTTTRTFNLSVPFSVSLLVLGGPMAFSSSVIIAICRLLSDALNGFIASAVTLESTDDVLRGYSDLRSTVRKVEAAWSTCVVTFCTLGIGYFSVVVYQIYTVHAAWGFSLGQSIVVMIGMSIHLCLSSFPDALFLP